MRGGGRREESMSRERESGKEPRERQDQQKQWEGHGSRGLRKTWSLEAAIEKTSTFHTKGG